MKLSAHLLAVGFVALLASQATLHADALDHWHLRASLPEGTRESRGGLPGIAYGRGVFIAVSGDIVKTSPDGVTWSTVAWTNQTAAVSTALNDVAYGNGIFVAVGYDSNRYYHEAATLTSIDGGITWTNQVLGFPFGALNRITYGQGVFVAVGGHVPSSSSRNIATSPDGLTWTARNSNLYGVLDCVTYGNGAFVAVGGSAGSCSLGSCGLIQISSDDGVTWGHIQTTNGSLRGITFGNGTFVAVGDNGTILTSVDTLNWTGRNSGSTANLFGVAYANRTFVTMNYAGIILQSDDVAIPCLSGRRFPNGSFEVTITGEIGRGYRVQASTHLVKPNWLDLLSFTITQPATNFLDTAATNFSQRFYRVVSP